MLGNLFCGSNDAPKAPHVVSLLRAVGAWKHMPPDDRLLGDVCVYMQTHLRSQDQRTRSTSCRRLVQLDESSDLDPAGGCACHVGVST